MMMMIVLIQKFSHLLHNVSTNRTDQIVKVSTGERIVLREPKANVICAGGIHTHRLEEDDESSSMNRKIQNERNIRTRMKS